MFVFVDEAIAAGRSDESKGQRVEPGIGNVAPMQRATTELRQPTQTPRMQRIMPGQRTRPHFRAPTASVVRIDEPIDWFTTAAVPLVASIHAFAVASLAAAAS